MPKAIWNGTVVAESDATEIVDGNHYFPPRSIHREFVRDSETRTDCSWKGTASYLTLIVDGQENKDAGWHYPEPKDAAKNIAGHIAFWKGVVVEP